MALPADDLSGEVRKRDQRIKELQNDVDSNKKILEDLYKSSSAAQLKTKELEAKLQEARKSLTDLEAANQFYPAAEVRQKVKLFVTV